MNVNPLQRQVAAADIDPERLAGNPRLTEEQKINEASRQFECVLVKQILAESQKTAISSEFSDDSTASSVYQDMLNSSMADSISKSGSFGLAKVFSQQLNRPSHTKHAAEGAPAPKLSELNSKHPAFHTQADPADWLKNLPSGARPLSLSVQHP